jgi:hypothetical protein
MDYEFGERRMQGKTYYVNINIVHIQSTNSRCIERKVTLFIVNFVAYLLSDNAS